MTLFGVTSSLPGITSVLVITTRVRQSVSAQSRVEIYTYTHTDSTEHTLYNHNTSVMS